MALKAGSLKLRWWRGWLLLEVLRENLAPGGCLQFLLFLGLHMQHSNLCLCLHVVFYKDNVIGLGFTLIQDGLMSRSLIKSTKTLLPNKGTFTGSE